jgi:hypothetical protein
LVIQASTSGSRHAKSVHFRFDQSHYSGLNSRFDRKNHAHKARRLAPIAALAVILLGILILVLYAKFDA